MRTNIEKWNFYKKLLDTKSSEYIEDTINDNVLDKFYSVDTIGEIHEDIISNIYCSETDVKFFGTKPSNKDINRIKQLASSDIVFSESNIIISYYELVNNYRHFRRLKYVDYIKDEDIFVDYEEAKEVSDKRKQIILDKEAFIQDNKKPSNYDYAANGYKCLGMSNAWKEEPVELKECVSKGHHMITSDNGDRSYTRTVSCPICKIYYGYDIGD